MTTADLVVLGGTGQIGRALARAALPPIFRPRLISREELDLAREGLDATSVLARTFRGRPLVVVNAAAFTAVDRAETEVETSFTVNAKAPRAIARACAQLNFPIIHLSTDYVFSGTKSLPYREDDPVDPLNIYGQSKWQGEQAVRQSTARHVILRTSWVYSPFGSNFVRTMLRLSRERPELPVVADQRGSPTAASDVAEAILAIAAQLVSGTTAVYGTFHYCGKGECSWYQFALEIFAFAKRYGVATPHLVPITTAEYAAPAQRPMNSVLECGKLREVYGIDTRPWQLSLRTCIDELFNNASE